jgi:hypothetical protein
MSFVSVHMHLLMIHKLNRQENFLSQLLLVIRDNIDIGVETTI